MASSKETLSSRHNRTHARINAQRLWLHAQGLRMFKSDEVTALRRGSKHIVIPLSKTLFAIDNAGKGKNNFLQWSNTGFINHPPVQVQCTGLVVQHKMDSIIFFWRGCVFSSGAFCFVMAFIFCLIDLLFVFIFIFFCYKKKEHEVWWVGR